MSMFEENSSPLPSEDDGEDLMENMADDYQKIDELDEYNDSDIDTGSYLPMDPRARQAAERYLDEQDGRRRFRDRMREDFFPAALHTQVQNEQTSQIEMEGLNLDDFDGPFRDWLEQESVQREVKRRLRLFLTNYLDTSNIAVYLNKIEDMCSANRCSLEVDYENMMKNSNMESICIWIVEAPKILLELFSRAAMEVVKYNFNNYDSVHPHIQIRIYNLPLDDKLCELRQTHLSQLVQVSGVVTRRTSKFPQLLHVKYDCIKCGFIIGPFVQQSNKEIRPLSCPDCQSNGPFHLNESQTVYRNYQKIVLQESPGSVPAGHIPRSRDVILVDDLCDFARPGEQIKIVGEYKNILSPAVNVKHGFPVFGTVIEANHIIKEKDYYSQYEITGEDVKNIKKYAEKPDIEEFIVNSICPSIYGHEYIKRAIAFSLFGGEEKLKKSKHRIRGDINILILGDPGMGKSQFLKYVENVAFRAVFATGKGASAVGLTASVRRDPITREWTLEGGALVLADRGVCLIDEFDKMNDSDRTSIHEAMEQQSISISKAGIVASLRARCAIIAAANPRRGRYDGSLTFVENVDLTDPILSRFDILAVVRDKVDPIQDEQLANFVVGNHILSHPNYSDDIDDDTTMKDSTNYQNTLNKMDQQMLRKYILYAKQTCHPKLTKIDRSKIARFYSDLRQKSSKGDGIPIAVRHIESILRMSEARAKMHLRNFVSNEDVDMAIRVMLGSFIDTQKQSNQTSLKHYFKSYLTYKQDSTQLLLHILERAVTDEMCFRQNSGDDSNQSTIDITLNEFRSKAAELEITNLEPFFKSDAFSKVFFLETIKISQGNRTRNIQLIRRRFV